MHHVPTVAATLVTLLLSAFVFPCRSSGNTGSFLRHGSPLSAGQRRAGDESLHPQIQSLSRGLDGEPPPALIQSNPAERRQEERVLYVLYSDSRFYGTRLRWVAETWGKKVPNGTLVAIGDEAPPDSLPLPVHETQCPRHSHEEGACCKYGEAVIEAGRRMQQDPSLAWAYFIDDDVYARPEAIAQFLTGDHDDTAGSPDNSSNGLVRGTFMCGSNGCGQGLCGGGGYAADRRAVEAMLSDGPLDFMQKQMENCNKCNRWADLAVSQFVLDKNITMGPLPGAYGWRMRKGEFDKSLERSSPEPLLYHYVQSEQQMSFLHSLFEPERRRDEPERQGAEERAGAEVLSRVVARVVSRVVGRLLGRSRSPVGSGCASFRGETTCRHGAAGLLGMPWLPSSGSEAEVAQAVAEAQAAEAAAANATTELHAVPTDAGAALAQLLLTAAPRSQAPAASSQADVPRAQGQDVKERA